MTLDVNLLFLYLFWIFSYCHSSLWCCTGDRSKQQVEVKGRTQIGFSLWEFMATGSRNRKYCL